MALRRINKELEQMKDPGQGITAGPNGEDMFHWVATLTGPEESPYEVCRSQQKK